MTSPRGKLYLVPNTLDFGCAPGSEPELHDVLPLGVIRIAARLGHWVTENAKTTRAFLKRVDAVVPLAQAVQALVIVELPRAQKGPVKAPPVALAPLLAAALQGHDIGLMSEAGLPAVADPGAALVQAAHELAVEVIALPGASSLMLALAASGLNGQSFAFVGYLPVDGAARSARIRDLESTSRKLAQTQLVIETPYRNEGLMAALIGQLQPGTRVSVSCGLTLGGAFSRTATVAQWRAAPARLPANVPVVFSLLADTAR